MDRNSTNKTKSDRAWLDKSEHVAFALMRSIIYFMMNKPRVFYPDEVEI